MAPSASKIALQSRFVIRAFSLRVCLTDIRFPVDYTGPRIARPPAPLLAFERIGYQPRSKGVKSLLKCNSALLLPGRDFSSQTRGFFRIGAVTFLHSVV
jgi:hypothetical protein